MNKMGMNKTALFLGGCLVSATVSAQAYILVDPGFDYVRVAPNYSGYYSYLPGDPYDYVGPNYSRYYNYSDTPYVVEVVDTINVVDEISVVDVFYPAVTVAPCMANCYCGSYFYYY